MSPPGFDLSAYLRRIRFAQVPSICGESLAALHRGHVTRIPFENLEIHLCRPMLLDEESLFLQMVLLRRGGYCFQMNLLFARALETIGFSFDLLQARVWQGEENTPPRSHALLLVHLGGQRLVADVGFGGGGLMTPIPLEPGVEFVQPHATFRLVESAPYGYMLQRREKDLWEDLYTFELVPCFPIDYRAQNFWLYTVPDSFFVRNRVCSIVRPEGAVSFFNLTLKIRSGDEVIERTLRDGSEYREALSEHLGLDLDADDVLKPLSP